MSSKLYTSARSTLSAAEKKSLAAFDSWLKRVRVKSNGDPVDGRQLCANLKAEAHFTGAGAFGDATELAAFLARCAQAHRLTKGMAKRVDGYVQTCDAHGAKGLPIPIARLRPNLLRYSTSKYAAAVIIERVLGKVARIEFDAGRLSPEDAFKRIAARWGSTSMTPVEKLSGGSVVWATFRQKKGTPRDDANDLAQALALPLPPRPSGTLLFELAYPAAKVSNHRFPTVADAGLIHLFRPAREVPPDPSRKRTWWGWTNPLGGWPAQPEIVHDNASLQVLRRAPRFVGRIR
jgi:hypothetical protein